MPKRTIVHPGTSTPVEYDEPEVVEETKDVETSVASRSSGSSSESSSTEVLDEQDGAGEATEDESEDGDGSEFDETV